MIKKPARKIIIKPEPFFTSLNSALEVYKKETLGLLFGSSSGVIDFAYTFQEAERKPSFCRWYEEIKDYLIQNIIENTGLKFIGTFHSHTHYRKNYPFGMSKGDSISLEDKSEKINLLFNLSSDRNGINVLLNAYYYDFEQNRIRLAKLVPSKKLENILQRNNSWFLNMFS